MVTKDGTVGVVDIQDETVTEKSNNDVSTKSVIENKLERKINALKRELLTMKRNEAESKEILRILDNLLEKLPENIIESFAKSKDFELYEKVLDRYGL